MVSVLMSHFGFEHLIRRRQTCHRQFLWHAWAAHVSLESVRVSHHLFDYFCRLLNLIRRHRTRLPLMSRLVHQT